MRQLPLCSADAEASRRVHEAYELLLADSEALHARLDRARAAYRTLREERDQVLKERDQARLHERYWQKRWELEQLCRTWIPTPTPRLEPMLKRLLTCAHPDKCAQGQPASELAHEMAVLINDMREQLEKQG